MGWLFMMRCMLALQPVLDVTRMHGESVRRAEMLTLLTLPFSCSCKKSISVCSEERCQCNVVRCSNCKCSCYSG